VSIWKYSESHFENVSERPETRQASFWIYIGRICAHSRPLTGLAFGQSESGHVQLVSVGEDRLLVEYDLETSCVANGVVILGAFCVEEQAKPTACCWHPRVDDDYEQRVITPNSDMKLREWNAENKFCRKTSLQATVSWKFATECFRHSNLVFVLWERRRLNTCRSLGPTFGGPLTQLAALKQNDSHYLAYATSSKMIGLMKLPLDGNPNKVMGLVAHPGQVTALAVSNDGTRVFTAGGADRTVNAWTVNTQVIDVAEAQAGDTFKPFLGLLPQTDLPDHSIYDEIVDYFYYLQLIRAEGQGTTASRKVNGLIALKDVPNLMRAIGYYPSETEILNIMPGPAPDP
jgi:WD40 repeat protein